MNVALVDPSENRREVAPLASAMTPMEMLHQAVTHGSSIEVLERLIALQERWEASQARKAFDEAVAKAKAEITPVVRNKEGHNSKRYVDFAAIARAVDPIITKHGLSYRFRTTQDERIHVTCVLSHRAGHFEETTLAGPADTSGNKNAIQAIGSTLTYLQRYSLVQALGLAAADDDDGAAIGSGDTVSDQQVENLKDMLVTSGCSEARFLKWVRTDPKARKVEQLDQIPADLYEGCVEGIKSFKKGGSK